MPLIIAKMTLDRPLALACACNIVHNQTGNIMHGQTSNIVHVGMKLARQARRVPVCLGMDLANSNVRAMPSWHASC